MIISSPVTERSEFILDGRRCLFWSADYPEALLVEPIDERDLDFIGRELDYLTAHSDKPFTLAAFIVGDWNAELSPWSADPVFGKEAFGDGAGKTLRFVEDCLLPEIQSRIPSLQGKDVILGGYSLAALFALWAGYESRAFSGIAAASPSVWFPGWMDYVKGRRPAAEKIYLSLGDQESRTRNRVMATVGSCISEYAGILSAQGVESALEWNPGNHFRDADLRTAKAFRWRLDSAKMAEETCRT